MRDLTPGTGLMIKLIGYELHLNRLFTKFLNLIWICAKSAQNGSKKYHCEQDNRKDVCINLEHSEKLHTFIIHVIKLCTNLFDSVVDLSLIHI